MISHEELSAYLLSQPDARLEHPFGQEIDVYKVGGEMFALVNVGSDPIRLSLRCDPQLAQTLRDKYETVLPGQHLNKKQWNTLLLTGQLNWPEVQDLIRHSYNLVIA